MAQEDFWDYLKQPIMSGAAATHNYMSSPLSHPVLQVLAGGGTPGQMQAGMAQAYAPNMSRTMEFLRDLGRQAGPPGGLSPRASQALPDVVKWWLNQDYINLPRQNFGPASHNLASGIYDRFMFPGVIQQMEQDPDFGPAIRQIMGRDSGYAEPG